MTCAKQTVTATIVAPDGRRYVGTNACANPQPACPRGDMPTGVGYHLCREVCGQHGHAEAAAIQSAAGRARGGTLYLEGHSYACAACLALAAGAGLEVVIGGPP
jgi:hypothetical protein